MKNDVFGTKGDFVTSPEISQLFGEIIGVWLVNLWNGTGRPRDVQLVELGPGRGTLMLDVLHTIQQLPGLRDAITSIHLVEASPYLRKTQACTFGFDVDPDDASVEPPVRLEGRKAPFVWHENFEGVPESPSYYICHEFFDALPVFQFERAQDGWREILVDIDESDDSPYNFRLIRSPAATKASVTLLNHPTRYAGFGVGAKVEVCPEAYGVAKAIAERVVKCGGAGLIVDYGRDSIRGDTFRGIRRHQFTSPLSLPGDSDLTADVDFSLLRLAANDAGARTHGPITQSTFLDKMGIVPRLQSLLSAAGSDANKARELRKGYERLVDVAGGNGMGDVYKVLAVVGEDKECYPF